MNDLIKTLTAQLGIGAEQAQAGVGAILKMISEQASRDRTGLSRAARHADPLPAGSPGRRRVRVG